MCVYGGKRACAFDLPRSASGLPRGQESARARGARAGGCFGAPRGAYVTVVVTATTVTRNHVCVCHACRCRAQATTAVCLCVGVYVCVCTVHTCWRAQAGCRCCAGAGTRVSAMRFARTVRHREMGTGQMGTILIRASVPLRKMGTDLLGSWWP